MPVSQGPNLTSTRTFLFAAGSLVAALALLWGLVQLTGSGDVQFKLGDDVFEVGFAETFADNIAEGTDGRPAPIPFSSLSRNRPIYVQHLGDDPETGWFAIDARSPSEPEACALEWDIDQRLFVDGCDRTSTFPADGEGLLRYSVGVDDEGKLIVDLNGEPGDEPGDDPDGGLN